jgi:hypothetical protein
MGRNGQALRPPHSGLAYGHHKKSMSLSSLHCSKNVQSHPRRVCPSFKDEIDLEGAELEALG